MAASLAGRAGVAVCSHGAWTRSPGDLIAYGRRMAVNAGRRRFYMSKEGRNSSVAISRWNDGTVYVNVNGHVEATTEIYDMKLQRMVGHLPALLHPDPKSVLGIGFGAGVSAGTFTRYPGIQKITDCEIEPVIPPASTQFFGAQDYRVALNPKTHIVFDDARHYLLTTHGQVRHYCVRSAGCVREGHGGTLFEGVFRIGQAAFESRRDVYSLCAAV